MTPLLDLPNATVKNGQLAANGPAYQALVLDSEQLPTSAPSRSSIPVATGKKILSFARSGLPVVVVGTAPGTVPGLDAEGDKVLQPVIASLLEQKSVHVVKSEAAVPGLLRRLGIRNTVTVRVSTTLINRLRTLSSALSTRAAQANGLVGPVTLTPYSITRVN